MIQDLVISVVFILYAISVLMGFGTILTWVERKQAAVMSDRIGANRAYLRIPFTQVKLVWWGLFHGMADGLKMLLKEDFKPKTYDWYAYAVAPWVVFTPVLLVFSVIPFGGQLIPGELIPALAGWFGERSYPMQIARLDAGRADRVRLRWHHHHRRDARRLVVVEQVLAAGRAARGQPDDLVRSDHGPDDPRADRDLRHRRSEFDRAAAVGTVLGVLPAWGIVLQPFAAILFMIGRDR